jgi:hypothetical protein
MLDLQPRIMGDLAALEDVLRTCENGQGYTVLEVAEMRAWLVRARHELHGFRDTVFSNKFEAHKKPTSTTPISRRQNNDVDLLEGLDTPPITSTPTPSTSGRTTPASDRASPSALNAPFTPPSARPALTWGFSEDDVRDGMAAPTSQIQRYKFSAFATEAAYDLWQRMYNPMYAAAPTLFD